MACAALVESEVGIRSAEGSTPPNMDSVSHANVLISAVTVFAATNVDDLVVLSAFFGDSKIKPWSIVSGQFLGIGALVLASAIAGAAAVAVPEGWPSILGVAPLALGVYKGVLLVRSRSGTAMPSDEDEPQPTAVGRSQMLAVAAVTLANGGDNIAVYVPLLAANRHAIALYVVVFAILTGVWCALGFLLVNNRLIGARLRRYGRAALPVVLVVIGLHILSGARVLLR